MTRLCGGFEAERCVVDRYDGQPCRQPVEEYVLGLTLCRRHHVELVDEILTWERARVDHARRQGQEAEERLRKLDRVKPTFKREEAGWSFALYLPAVGREPRRTVRRRGFKTKRDAQWEARQILESLTAPLRAGAEAFAMAVKNEQRLAAEHWAQEQEEHEAARLAACESAARARRERERERLVYYVRRPDGAIKIGTTWNLKTRMQAFRNVTAVELLASHSGGQVAEAALHRRFKHLRLDGEWFDPGEDLLAHIRHVAACAERRGSEVAA